MSKEQEIVQTLSEFGLFGNDVKTLTTLIKFTTLTANQLARQAGIPRPEVYRILKKLEKMKLIQSLLQRPKKFKVVKPEMLVDQLVAAEKERMNRLMFSKTMLINALKTIDKEKAAAAEEEEESVHILTGMRQVYDKKIELCRSAKNRIDYMVSSVGICLADHNGLIDILRKCSHKVPVRILAEIDKANTHEVELCSKFAELRQASKIPFYIMIIDGRWTVIGITAGLAKRSLEIRCNDMWIESRGWARLFQRFFEEMWNSANPFKLADAILGTKLPTEKTSTLKGEEGIWIVDINFNTTYVNTRMAEILGYTQEDMVGKNLEEFCSQKWKKILHRLENRRRDGIKERHEFEFLKKDGSPIKTLIYTQPIKNQDGQFTGAIAILREK